MGYDAESARGLIRVSLGRFNTQQEVDRFLDVLSSAVSALPAAAVSASPPGVANPAEVAFA
jgi:cysteine sulfinate desulfinase/cysteine desulfurase-like protein